MSSAHSDDVHFDLTADSDETEGASAIRIESEDWGHGVGVSEEEAYEASAIFLGLDQDEGVDT